MSLHDVPLKAHYISGVDDLVHGFYIPMLERSVLYQRRTGYFNSRALAMAGRGLSGLIRNKGRMQLICSVELEEEEREIYEDPSKHVRLLGQKAEDIAKTLDQPADNLEELRLMLLAELLSRGLLEIRIAYPKAGIYHEKAGIFIDAEGNKCAFNGSDNETPGGWLHNTESFHVFTSWQDARHIAPEVQTFDKLWNNRMTGTTVIPLPEAVRRKILHFKRSDYEEGFIEPGDPASKEVRVVDRPEWQWTPELAYIFEAPRLWNHHDFAYGEVGITPFPHQDYVASNVLKGWPPRCMLCDEVGLGKTIEAGLILHGYMSAGRLDRTLILAPKNILRQWQLQLYTKFNITAWRLEGNYLEGPILDPNQQPERVKADIDNPFRTKDVILASSQLIRAEARTTQVLAVPWDMIMLDEAHHARARGPSGRREPNLLLQAMDQLKLQTQGLVFMTATPIQLDRKELWDLLMLLELPGGWQDEDAFDSFFSEINEERPDWAFLFSLANDTIRAFGDDPQSNMMVQNEFKDQGVDVDRLMQLIRTNKHQVVHGLDQRDQEALKLLLYHSTPVYRMIYRNGRELLKRYHREGKLKERIADREPQANGSVRLQGDAEDERSELGLYLEIDDYVRDYYARYNDVRKGMGFIMEVYRKRLTSSFHAIKLSLERRKARLAEALQSGDYGLLLGMPSTELEDTEDLEEVEEEGDSIDPMTLRANQMRAVIQAEHDFLDRFIGRLRDLPSDSKTEHLDGLLREEFKRGTRQVIIFSQFMDTVNYLLEYLQPQYGNQLGSYSGIGGSYWNGREWANCSKQSIQQKFTDDQDPLSILICTDAAAEGLDLQTCNVVINYDIPWNPMRIEQRIGRVDRIGQRSPKVYIHNLFYEGTVEETVYTRCLERIDNFRTTLGNVQPILVEMERLIRNGAMARTREEGQRVLEQVDQSIQRSVAELDENMRIMHLLNQYEPLSRTETKSCPISQQELEAHLGPLLVSADWTKGSDYYSKGLDVITFAPKVLDKASKKARLITPNSNLVSLFGTLPDIPEIISDPSGWRMHRVDIDGSSAFIVEEKGTFRAVRKMEDIAIRKGQRFPSLVECESDVRSEILQRKRQNLNAQLHQWQNRLEGWESRARLYLDQVLNWRWREVYLRTVPVSDAGVSDVWKDYISDQERGSTKQLADLCRYRPTSVNIRNARGRQRSSSPRSSGLEEKMLSDRAVVKRRTDELKAQLGAS